MAKVTQVVLMKSKTYQDGRRKFIQNVPVTLQDRSEIERYRSNGMFSVREIDDNRPSEGISSQKVNPGDPFAAPASEMSTRLPQRKKKSVKKLTPKQKE